VYTAFVEKSFTQVIKMALHTGRSTFHTCPLSQALIMFLFKSIIEAHAIAARERIRSATVFVNTDQDICYGGGAKTGLE
jgi:hypothetical protein